MVNQENFNTLVKLIQDIKMFQESEKGKGMKDLSPTKMGGERDKKANYQVPGNSNKTLGPLFTTRVQDPSPIKTPLVKANAPDVKANKLQNKEASSEKSLFQRQ